MSDSTISRKINPPVACVSKWIGCVARAATLGPPMGGVLLRVSGRFIEIIEAKENGIDTFMKYVETSGSQEEMPYYWIFVVPLCFFFHPWNWMHQYQKRTNFAGWYPTSMILWGAAASICLERTPGQAWCRGCLASCWNIRAKLCQLSDFQATKSKNVTALLQFLKLPVRQPTSVDSGQMGIGQKPIGKKQYQVAVKPGFVISSWLRLLLASHLS